MSGAGLNLPASLGEWLLEHGAIEQADLASPFDFYVLNKQASNEFENGVQWRGCFKISARDGDLDTLKENNAPVAKLYNWNLLLPKLRQRGLDVDQDMKVLIVAGDTDIVVDLLEQLQKAPYASPVSGGGATSAAEGLEAAGSIPPPQSIAESTTSCSSSPFAAGRSSA